MTPDPAKDHAQLYIHSWNYRFQRRYEPGFSFFDLIEDVRLRGFDGINVSVYGPEYEHLGGGDVDYLHKVRDALEEAGLGIDIEHKGTSPDHLRDLLKFGNHLGAGILRTFTTTPDDETSRISQAVKDLRSAAAAAEDSGIRIALENHEDLDGTQVAEIVTQVDSPWVGVLFDYGNSVMRGQHPDDALNALLPWVLTAHLKDQVFLEADHHNPAQTLGVPIGSGQLAIRDTTARLLAAGVPQLCFENTWSYTAPLRKTPPTDDRRPGGFYPFLVPDDNPRYFLGAAELERSDPRQLARLESQMLDVSCTGLRRVLDGLPVSLPAA